MPIQILKRRKSFPSKVSELRKRIALILGAAGIPGVDLSVALIGDEEMRELNLKYRGVDKPTDVLSFSQIEGDFGDIEPNMIGDVVISVDTAGRQAKKAGHRVEKELDILLTHGILHLVGYDHEKGEKEASKMRAQEKEILSMLAKVKTPSY